jgi:tetraacyldisaccharide 4'-kinase
MFMKELRKVWWIRLILYPISIIYGIIMDFRNYLFDRRILATRKFDIPIISIGNITAGGTGKTPFTMLCLDLLQPYYRNMVVVSRGYGRKTKGLQIVSDGSGNILSAAEGGDEPVMIAKKYPQLPVIVSENRTDGVTKAIQLFGADLVLLDDAFQHRWIDRRCDIALISDTYPLNKECMLPMGNLRENLNNIERADIIVRTYTSAIPDEDHSAFLREIYPGPVFDCHFSPNRLIDPNFKNAGELAQLKEHTVLAFAAIAEPEQFHQMLISNGLVLNEFISFPDHYFFTNADMQRIKEKVLQSNTKYLITTEKDMVKLDPAVFEDLNLVGMSLKGSFKNSENFVKKLLHFIDIRI